MNALEYMEDQIRRLPGGTTTFFSNDEFSWVREVEGHFSAIQAELGRLLKATSLLPGFEQIQAEQEGLTADRRWKIFPLYASGKFFNSRRCPATVEALSAIPELKAAMFSILQPGKVLPPHRGVYSGILRYHLGLRIPQPNSLCGITVGGDTRHWEEGGSLIFDDSHEHTAWNGGGEDRVVLFVDFSRPLPRSLRATNEAVISSIHESDFIQGAIERWSKWEAIFGEEIDKLVHVDSRTSA